MLRQGEKEGSDRPIHLDLEPRRTHLVRRAITYTSTHPLGYTFFRLSFVLLRMQAIGRDCQQKPDQAHMYSCLYLYGIQKKGLARLVDR